MRTTLALCLVLSALPGCRKDGGRPVPGTAVVDRSNGALPELRALRVAPGELVLDGKLDEPAWSGTGTTDAFVSTGSGAPEPGSRVQAAAWVAWDDERLYVAARIEEIDPVAGCDPGAEDPHVWERSSGLELMLQPGDPGDNREYFEIQLDPGRALWATAFDDYNRPITDGPEGRRFGRQEWAPAIESGVRVDAAAGNWTLEFAVPWADVRSTRTAVPPRAGDVWRMNFYSFRDGQADALAWSPIRGEGNFHFAGRFGRVIFDGGNAAR